MIALGQKSIKSYENFSGLQNSRWAGASFSCTLPNCARSRAPRGSKKKQGPGREKGKARNQRSVRINFARAFSDSGEESSCTSHASERDRLQHSILQFILGGFRDLKSTEPGGTCAQLQSLRFLASLPRPRFFRRPPPRPSFVFFLISFFR
jgi:hypothetical protein